MYGGVSFHPNQSWRTRAAKMLASGVLAAAMVSPGMAQGPAGPGGPGQPPPPPPPPTAGAKLQIADGSSASYKVNEQFVGISFPNDAIGTSNGVSGTLNIAADGSIAPGSKLTVDLKGLKSDQDQRDNFVRTRTLETDKYPEAVFVPTKITGIPTMIPFQGQTGFEMAGDLTVHGVTKPVTFHGYATFNRDGSINGRGETSFTFANFGLNQPKIQRLMSVGDTITLDLVFRFKRV